jgi:hypothetical protein
MNIGFHYGAGFRPAGIVDEDMYRFTFGNTLDSLFYLLGIPEIGHPVTVFL